MKNNKIEFVISIHSFIDVITNSSSEIFVCDTDKILEDVTALVKAKEKEWPSEYGYHVSISLEQASNYLDNYYYEYQIPEMVKFLKSYGFEITEPKEEIKEKQVIVVSCERGVINPLLRDWIIKTFNSELIDY